MCKTQQAYTQFTKAHGWAGADTYFKNMICYAFFSGIATEHLDAFVLRMDSYVMGGEEEGYITWIGQEETDFVHNLKDFLEGR